MWKHAADRMRVRPRWRETHNSFSAGSQQAHFQSISYISPRQLLVVGKEFVGDVCWNFFRLQPESHSASLHNLIGQLSFQRDDWRREEKFRVQIQCCNYLLITKAERRAEEITGRVNDRKVGDAKAGKPFFFDKKIKKKSKRFKEKSEQSEKGRSGEKSRIVRGRLKRQQGNYLREDRLKWTKRDCEQPGESARGTYLDVWCHSWVRASLPSLKWEETMDSSPGIAWTCAPAMSQRNYLLITD